MSGPALELRGVTAGYAGAAVVRDIDLSVDQGELVALLGPNGAGKSTTLRVISGLVRPMKGEVEVLGASVVGTSPQRIARRGVAHVSEGRSIFADLTVAEHFKIGVRGEAVDKEVAYGWFPALRPLDGQRAGLLSGGEQQMLSLARGLARRPGLLLIDELSLGLAPVIVERLLPVIRELATELGCGVLLVEQHVHLALEFADTAYVLSHGSMILTSDAASLRENPDMLVGGYFGGSMPEASSTDTETAAEVHGRRHGTGPSTP